MDDLPKLGTIWAVKLKIPLMNRKYLLFDAMGPFIHFRRYGTKNLFSTLWILTLPVTPFCYPIFKKLAPVNNTKIKKYPEKKTVSKQSHYMTRLSDDVTKCKFWTG